LADSFRLTRPELSAERLSKAEEHDHLAAKYTRRAWPFQDREQVT
jgi:hypothetical protein